MKNRFSVLLAVYHKDNPVFFKDALDSIVNQTLMPSEIVIVKDGPLTNELDFTLHSFIDEFPSIFKIIELPKNGGLGNALNIGLENCNYEIVIRMDADDICYVNRFEKQINYLTLHPQISVLGTTIEEFNETPGDLKRFRKLPLENQKLLKFARYRNPVNHPSVVFRKAHIQEVGSYQDMPLFEDYYLWIRVLKRKRLIANLEEPLLHFRIGNDMIGRRHGLSYFQKEYFFLKTIRKLGFISNVEFLTSITVKFPLRLLPKKYLSFFYKVLLR